MSIKLADAIVYFKADQTPLQQAQQQSERATRGWMGRVGDVITNAFGYAIGTVAVNAVKNLTQAVVANAGEMISAASDLNESSSKVGVVFGDNAQHVWDFAQTTAEAMGISENATLAAAGTFGNLFVTLGLGQRPAAQMSTDLVQLAADLASFNNLDPTEVLDKLRAGLVGEAEPMRALGVNINEAAVQAKALELGLIRTGEAMTDSDKVQARFALMMEQSATAQGDFARTSDGLANQQRILNAVWEDTQATIGTALLPAVTGLVTALTPMITALLPSLQGILEGLQPIMLEIGTQLQENLPRIIEGLLALFGGDMQTSIANFGAIIYSVLGPEAATQFLEFASWLQERLPQAMVVLQTAFNDVWPWIQSLVAQVVTWFQANLPLMEQAGANVVAFFQYHVAPALDNVWNIIKTIVETALGLMMNQVTFWLAVLAGDWDTAWLAIQTAFVTIWEGLVTILGEFLEGILNTIGSNTEEFVSVWRGNWEMAVEIVTTIFNQIKDFIGSIDLGELARNMLQGFISGVQSMAGAVVDAVGGVIGSAIDAAKERLGISSPSKVFDWIAEMSVSGFTNRMLSSIPQVGAAVRETLGAGAQAAQQTVSNVNYYLNPTYMDRESQPSLAQTVRGLQILTQA